MAAMGAGPSQEAAVWPTGWCVASIAAPASLAHCEPVPLAHRSEIPAEQRLVARQAILQISTVPREEFLAIESEHYCISHDDWSFEAYHGAAAAAVQEDKGLNRMIYCIVPRCARLPRPSLAIPAQQHCLVSTPHHLPWHRRKRTESDFWRLVSGNPAAHRSR